MRDLTSPATPADIRAAIARSGLPAYVIGARARINPIRLSRLVRGREQITDELASRLLLAIQQLAQEGAAHGQ